MAENLSGLRMDRLNKILSLIAPPWWLIPSNNTVTATEHLVEDYSYNLTKNGFENIIFSRKKDQFDIHDIEDVNCYNNRYNYTALNNWDRKYLRKIVGKKYTYSLLFYLFYIIKVSLKIRKMKLTKAIVFQTFTFCFWLKILNPNLSLIYHIGNHELGKKSKYFNYGVINDKLAKKVIPKIDYIVAVSEYIKKGIIDRFPHLCDKCTYVYPGIDLEIFKSKWEQGYSDDKVIIYTGRVVPEKGLHILVEAFKLLKQDYPNIILQIYGIFLGPNGDDSYLQNLKDNSIKILGLHPRKEIANILKKATVFVYPVIWEEALGLAPLEAMAVGLPVVVSDVRSGYSEIINSQNGFYFASGDSVQLKEILKEILNSQLKQINIGHKARETINDYLSWDQCIKRTTDLFNGGHS